MSYLSEAETKAIQRLHKRAPYVIKNISNSYFSVARLYGSMFYQGCQYLYMAESDECVRIDVVKHITKRRNGTLRKKPPNEQPRRARRGSDTQGA